MKPLPPPPKKTKKKKKKKKPPFSVGCVDSPLAHRMETGVEHGRPINLIYRSWLMYLCMNLISVVFSSREKEPINNWRKNAGPICIRPFKLRARSYKNAPAPVGAYINPFPGFYYNKTKKFFNLFITGSSRIPSHSIIETVFWIIGK